MTASGAQDHFAHTEQAEANRRRKAQALAAAAARLGLQPYELTLVGGTVADAGRRKAVRLATGLDRDPSVETWSWAIGALEQRLWAVTGISACDACGWPVIPVRTEAGRLIAIDPMPRQDGSVYRRLVKDRWVGVVVPGHETPPQDEPLFRQHSRSCPTSSGRARAEAPRCVPCGFPLDGVLAARDPTYTEHPTCGPSP